jgi:hypothetical protein
MEAQNYLRVVVTVYLLHSEYKLSCSLGEILETLHMTRTHSRKTYKTDRYTSADEEGSFTYHALDIQDGGGGVNVPLGS